MRHFFLACGLILGTLGTISAQKFGYVDTEYILSKMPEYQEAQQELDQISVQYQKEIELQQSELDAMIDQLQLDELILPPELVRERKKEIEEKRQEIREFQRKIFGFEGLIFLKRQELIQPVQDKVYTAAATVARKQRLQFIFDKSADLTIIYADPIHDYTDFVLEELDLGDPKDVIDNPR